MRLKTERRKTIREAHHQEKPWWASKEQLDAEMKRRLELIDRPRSSSVQAFKNNTDPIVK